MSTQPNLKVESDAPDPFDPESLKVSGIADVGIEKLLTVVQARKPGRQEFFRVHPDPGYTLDTAIFVREEKRETYLVTPAARELLLAELRIVRLFTCVSKHGAVFLWPAKLPTEDTNVGKSWQDSALRAAEEGKTKWVRLAANMPAQQYDVMIAQGDFGEPSWPDKTFPELLRMAFADKLVDRADHPVIRELAGEI